jgi:hypothetical protein
MRGFIEGRHVHRARKPKRVKGAKMRHVQVRAHVRRLHAPKLQETFTGFQNPINIWHKQLKREAFHHYVLKHVGEAGDVPGKFTASLPQFKEAFANLEAAGLVVTEPESKPTWPFWATWDTPAVKYQTAYITDLGAQRLQEDDRSIPELHDDFQGMGDGAIMGDGAGQTGTPNTSGVPWNTASNAWANVLATALPDDDQ